MNYLEDILLFAGMGVLVLATFLWSAIGGLYVAGAFLFGLGVYFTRHPPGRR